ncbi:hypothetical protein LINPERPRIM_LOCUS3015, partial [Linum perenne]
VGLAGEGEEDDSDVRAAESDELKLKYCRQLPQGALSRIPNEGILHRIIHEASLLETLTLISITVTPDWKLQVRNHPNLKLLKVQHLGLDLDLFEIRGIQSLEEVRVIGTHMKEFRIWSTPNLKVVCTVEVRFL